MKLPITDTFLWELYNSVEGIEKIYNKTRLPRNMYEAMYRDTIHLREKYEREERKRTFSQFISYLQAKGYIRVKTLEGKKGVILTPKGITKAIRANRRLVHKKQREDGKWIMVMFDIPEEKRTSRDILRTALMDLGYEKFQQSVWVSKYDVFNETETMIREYRVIPYTKLFLIEEIT